MEYVEFFCRAMEVRDAVKKNSTLTIKPWIVKEITNGTQGKREDRMVKVLGVSRDMAS